MSFLKDIVGFFTGNSIASSIAKIAALTFVSKKLNNSAIKANDTASTPVNIDKGVRLQIEPAADNNIPVLYGSAYFGGIITDAVMTNTNKTMFYCLTLCEKTGTKLSDSQPSAFIFKDVYWNDQRMIFKNDGITVDYTVDRAGTVDRSLENQVKVYCYAGDSDTPVVPENYTNPSLDPAYDVMPNWTTSTHVMNDLVFSIIRVDYNREKNVTGLGNILFHIDNSMRLPGDVLNDYMTNSRYGAGIASEEIKIT